MKKLISISIDCGRMGSLNALEIYDEKDWDNFLKSKESGLIIYEYDILGKHSEIEIRLDELKENEFLLVSEEQDKIEWLQSLFGTKHISGNFGICHRLQDLLDEQ